MIYLSNEEIELLQEIVLTGQCRIGLGCIRNYNNEGMYITTTLCPLFSKGYCINSNVGTTIKNKKFKEVAYQLLEEAGLLHTIFDEVL